MKSAERSHDKQLYDQLRQWPSDRLWTEEVARFDRATPEERARLVAVIRAVGVVFSESGTVAQKEQVRPWLRHLLQDPSEKVRRYAMSAIPKLGAGPEDEAELLALFGTTTLERERKFLAATLEKIGGPATLQQIERKDLEGLAQSEQKVKASLARQQSPSVIRMDRILSPTGGLRVHLHSRRGLEPFVRMEVEEQTRSGGPFRVADVRRGMVALTATAPFTLADLYRFRCFERVGFVLGQTGEARQSDLIGSLAAIITSPLARRIFESLTDGSIRYRLDFVAKGHQRHTVRRLADRVYSLAPAILNDARDARWVVAIRTTDKGAAVELCPHLPSDPRFEYRRADVPAASHPPLAACMARLAGRFESDIVWDPFCGSGLELVERALLGGVRRIYGTDLSGDAIAIATANFAAAHIPGVEAEFACADFRATSATQGLGPGSVSLIITNPPMGHRVPVANLRGLIDDLFSVAATVLKPGGRLVFANPLRMETAQRSLKLESRQVVDLGLLDCRLEKYVKCGSHSVEPARKRQDRNPRASKRRRTASAEGSVRPLQSAPPRRDSLRPQTRS